MEHRQKLLPLEQNYFGHCSIFTNAECSLYSLHPFILGHSSKGRPTSSSGKETAQNEQGKSITAGITN